MTSNGSSIEKLIYVSNARLPTEKAHGVQIMKMCEAFARHGKDVKLLHPYRSQPDGGVPDDPFPYYDVDRTFTIRTLRGIDGLAWARRFAPGWRRAGFQLQAVSHVVNVILATRRYWRDHRVLLYSRDPYAAAALASIQRLRTCSLLFEAHAFPDDRDVLLRQLGKVDGLVVITEALRALFESSGFEGRITVEPDAVDLDAFSDLPDRQTARRRLGLQEDRPIVGYVGRFRTMGREKGLPDLIRAMRIIADDSPDLDPMLLCVGGPMEAVDAYGKLAREIGLAEASLLFVDRVPLADVPLWNAACDVLTIPWPWTTFSAYYTSPMKLFEYMASERPIVASKLPALEEILRHDENALLFEPGDPTSLARNIVRVLKEPETAVRLTETARHDVTPYTWTFRAGRILAFAEELNAQRPAT